MIRFNFNSKDSDIFSRFCAVPLVALAMVAMSGCSRGNDDGLSMATPSAEARADDYALLNPDFDLNYSLRNINAIEAYHRNIFGEGVTIGIADSSVEANQRDLQVRVGEGRNFASRGVTNANTDPHGTFVALFAAASAGGDAKSDFTFGTDSNPHRVGNMHGVAPRASLSPLQLGDSTSPLVGNAFEALNWAVDENIQIVNNSYVRWARLQGTYNDRDWFFEAPLFSNFITNERRREQLFRQDQESARLLTTSGSTTVQDLNNKLNFPEPGEAPKDTVFVWAAGNESWHEGATIQLTNNNFERLNVPQSMLYDNGNNGFLVTLITVPGGVTMGFQELGLGSSGLNINPNDAGFYPNIPLLTGDNPLTNLRNNWLVVGAVDADNRIAAFSNGCGSIKERCLVAPGVNLAISGNPSGHSDSYTRSGTSFAAPLVSGALALLRSNAPTMPMTMIANILLDTANSEGHLNDEDIYGQGLLDVGAAILYQISMTASTPGGTNLAVVGTQAQLPSSFAGVRDQLQFAATPIYGPDGTHHYNAKLSDFVGVESASSAKLGDAAADMLTPVSDNRFYADSLFAATDPKTNQFHYIGADIDGGEIGTWRFHHQFCEDCETSSWNGWNLLNNVDDVAATPFFARDETAVVLQMQGEGLRPFAAMGGDDVPYQQFGVRWRESSSRMSYLAEVSQIDESETFAGANFGELGQTETRTHQGRFAIGGSLSDDWHGYASMEYARMNTEVSGGSLLGAIDGAHAKGWTAGIEHRNLFTGGDRIRFSARHDGAVVGGTARFSYFDENGDTQQLGARLQDNSATVLALGYAFSPVHNTWLSFGVERESSRGALSAQLQTAF